MTYFPAVIKVIKLLYGVIRWFGKEDIGKNNELGKTLETALVKEDSGHLERERT